MAIKLKRGMIISGVIVLMTAAVGYTQRGQLRDWYYQRDQQKPVPVEKTVTDFEIIQVQNNNINSNNSNNSNISNSNLETSEQTIIIPDSINLAIPFTSQAPTANWELPYQEACEEASMLMAGRFLQGRPIAGVADADQAILELADYNANTMNYPIDMTAAETAQSIEILYDLKTELIYDFSWDDVKQALAQGYPVILPAAGRQLGNPYYTAPGPLYHMLVIKGYTANKIITNDPGTKRGSNYQYSYDALYNAAHDWNGGDVANGRKVIIVVKPS